MIIAEIGQNHMGSMWLAEHLILQAKDNGADLVKFQLYDSEKLYGEKQETELSFEQAKHLFNFGKKAGIEIFFSVFDELRVQWCENIGVKRYKIAARNEDKNLWDIVDKTEKPTIISYDPVFDKYGWPDKWESLYCVSEYPAKSKNIKFEAGDFEDTGDSLGSGDGRGEYWRRYEGFSDHTIGLDFAMIALSRGARIIEKHFAITHEIGIDAPWSMTPDELRELKTFERKVQEVL